ncbi:MAG: hypothetical protein ACRDDZ_06285 [Marinifilaceae bacterium]
MIMYIVKLQFSVKGTRRKLYAEGVYMSRVNDRRKVSEKQQDVIDEFTKSIAKTGTAGCSVSIVSWKKIKTDFMINANAKSDG